MDKNTNVIVVGGSGSGKQQVLEALLLLSQKGCKDVIEVYTASIKQLHEVSKISRDVFIELSEELAKLHSQINELEMERYDEYSELIDPGYTEHFEEIESLELQKQEQRESIKRKIPIQNKNIHIKQVHNIRNQLPYKIRKD